MKLFINKVCMLICALLIVLIPTTTFASTINGTSNNSNVVVNASVPQEHTFTVNANGADVFFDGTEVFDSVSVKRQSTPVVLVRAQSGRKITSVILNGKDVSNELVNGMITLSNVISDGTLVVTTEKEVLPNSLTYTVTGTVKQNGKPINGITLELRSSFKTTITENNGVFHFDEVESGHHSLTALKNGKVVGYLEFELKSDSNSKDLTFYVDENGILIVNVPVDTESIDFDLNLNEDGTLNVENVVQSSKNSNNSNDKNDKTDSKNSNKTGTSPLTGYETYIIIFATLFAVCIGVFVILETKKRRKNNK